MLYRFLFVVYCICCHIRSVFFQYKNPNVRWCYGLLRRMTELRCALVHVGFINHASHNSLIFVCQCTISDFILKIYFRIKSKVYPSTSNDGLCPWGISCNFFYYFNTFMQRVILMIMAVHNLLSYESLTQTWVFLLPPNTIYTLEI